MPVRSTATPSPEASERTWELATKVIDLARGMVVSESPFLSSAIGLLALRPAPPELTTPLATDGAALLVDASDLLASFSRQREAPVRDLVHVLLHCVLLHPFVAQTVDAQAWDLACDMTVEALVDEICGERIDSRGKERAAALKEAAAALNGRLTGERLYHLLCEGAFADQRASWAALFHVDDHAPWPPHQAAGETRNGGGPANGSSDPADQDGGTSSTSMPQAGAQPQGSEAADTPDGQGRPSTAAGQRTGDAAAPQDAIPSEDQPGTAPSESTGQRDTSLTDAQLKAAEQAWERAAKSLRVDLETLSRTRGASLGKLVRELEVGTHERVDYRDFLRQFAVERENMRLSDDEFDYIFYTYGLELLGNVPLVEPLEYKSEKRIRDFVIVIDTSSSVSAKVVQEFVDATFDVLSSEGGFFAQTNIHIIQADARVQSDAKITSVADLDRWRRSITLRGFGGTDFRPAFRYVQQLRQAGEFEDLQGLIYFTDGWGIYPERMPPYKCAFVFYDEDHRPELVPPWAIQVVLHPGSFESLSVY